MRIRNFFKSARTFVIGKINCFHRLVDDALFLCAEFFNKIIHEILQGKIFLLLSLQPILFSDIFHDIFYLHQREEAE